MLPNRSMNNLAKSTMVIWSATIVEKINKLLWVAYLIFANVKLEAPSVSQAKFTLFPLINILV
jgi:hypothetical protein